MCRQDRHLGHIDAAVRNILEDGGHGTVCVWSPPLDDDGNSAGGIAAIEEFTRLAGWSVFRPTND